jgi:hypothetical protein
MLAWRIGPHAHCEHQFSDKLKERVARKGERSKIRGAAGFRFGVMIHAGPPPVCERWSQKRNVLLPRYFWLSDERPMTVLARFPVPGTATSRH